MKGSPIWDGPFWANYFISSFIFTNVFNASIGVSSFTFTLSSSCAISASLKLYKSNCPATCFLFSFSIFLFDNIFFLSRKIVPSSSKGWCKIKY